MGSYERSFTVGRGSELLYNEELHKIYEATRHLMDEPEDLKGTPEAKLNGALWLDKKKNELKTFEKSSNSWKTIFDKKFQIVDQITNVLPGNDPVNGQLWLYNDVLMYWDGANWKPVKALLQDGSQFNLSLFQNFEILSPLWKIGNTVIKDEDVAAFDELKRKYLQAKLDYDADDTVAGTGEKWNEDHRCKEENFEFDGIRLDGYAQILVPNIDMDRIFMDQRLDFNYEQESKVCISYRKDYIKDFVPSCIHMNPGRLTAIKKRLIKIDRKNPFVGVKAGNTEFYGFRTGRVEGHLLLPESEPDDGGYIIENSGIYLSRNYAQNYDYVLAVSYEFSWIKETGIYSHLDNRNLNNSFYIQNFRGPMNVFVEGLDLESERISVNNMTQTISIKDDVTDLEVSMLHVPTNEYGFVREVDSKNRAVVKTIRNFRNPLIFMNGEALSMALGDFERDPEDQHIFYVVNGQYNMGWTVIELEDMIRQTDSSGNTVSIPYDMYYGAGVIRDVNREGERVIRIDPVDIKDNKSFILFVNGLLVKKEDMVIGDDYITAGGISDSLSDDLEYILLRDKYNYLYDENMLTPALSVGKLSESLVYLNGYLLLNSTAVDTVSTEKILAESAVHNEVKRFLGEGEMRFLVYDADKSEWNPVREKEADGILFFVDSYINNVSSITFNTDIKKEDRIDIYAFNYAGSIEHPLVIRTVEAHGDSSFKTDEIFTSGIGSLSVWLNGIRQYEAEEFADGTGFMLHNYCINPNTGVSEDVGVTGLVTYIIEKPENGAKTVAAREILTEKNLVPGAINVYKTEKPLYPGRVIVYVDGIRQPQSAYTILDNFTLLFNGEEMLTGNSMNYPEAVILLEDGTTKNMVYGAPDRILVEVKAAEDNGWREKAVQLEKDTAYDIDVIKYDIPLGILEASDEVLIFIDGCFLGLRELVGYSKDKNRGVITVRDSSAAGRIMSDPLYNFLKSDRSAMERYIEMHGKEYEKKARKIILEWR